MKYRFRNFFLLTIASAPALCFAQKSRPNIIYIMCDDMGYGDLGCYGQRLISTPNIDRMAAEGMRFTQAYAGAPVSAPSRACLMTGQHTGHTHVRGNKEYWSQNDLNLRVGKSIDYSVIGQEPYDSLHPIIPEIMKSAGYATGMFGKWAGGYLNINDPSKSSCSTPDKRGIDDFYGYICQYQAHSYYPNMLQEYHRGDVGYENGVVNVVLQQNVQHAFNEYDKDYEKREQYSAALIHHKALQWLEEKAKNPEQPFIGIFTYTLPHAELWQPKDSILEMYNQKFAGNEKSFTHAHSRYHVNDNSHAQFASMITRLDTQVGEIMAKLKDLGLDKNTIVFFTSDNGSHEEGGGDPSFFGRDGKLKGIKRSTYEGGIRIPFIAKGPGIKAGKTNDHIFAFYDLMPTFCDIAGIDSKSYSMKIDQEVKANDSSKDYFDGISIYPTLRGKNKKQQKHRFLYWEFNETEMLALRMDEWKLVIDDGVSHLYNLDKDLHEDNDVKNEYPEILKEMTDIIYQQHIDSKMFPVTMPKR